MYFLFLFLQKEFMANIITYLRNNRPKSGFFNPTIQGKRWLRSGVGGKVGVKSKDSVWY